MYEQELRAEKERLEDDLKMMERINQEVKDILSKRIDHINKELEKHALEQ